MLDIRAADLTAIAAVDRMRYVSDSPPILEMRLQQPAKRVIDVVFDGKTSNYYTFTDNSVIRIIPPKPKSRRITVLVEPVSMQAATVRFNLTGCSVVTGPERLLQVVARLLATEPGSIMDHEDTGACVNATEANDTGPSGVPYLLRDRVTKLERKIISVQSAQVLQDSERLKSIEILGAAKAPSGAGTNLHLRINSHAGSVTAYLGA